MKELGKKKALASELRQQEGAVRKMFAKTRYWMINTIIGAYPNAKEVGPAIHRELAEEADLKAKAIAGEMAESEYAKWHDKKLDVQILTISEEKQTRKMFEAVLMWVWRSNLRARKKVQKEKKRTNRTVSANPDLNSLLLSQQMPSHTNESMVLASEEAENGDGGEGNSETEAVVALAQKEEGPSESDESDASEDEMKLPDFNQSLPSISRAQLQSFLDILKIYLDLERKKNRAAAKRARALQVKAAQDRREEAMKAGGGGGGTDAHNESSDAAEANRVTTAVAVTATIESNAEKDEEVIPNPNDIVPHQFQLLPEEIEITKDLRWIKLLDKDPQFRVAFENLPVMEEGRLARDELIQFASICIELEPVFFKVANAIQKAKDDIAIAAGLKSKKTAAAATKKEGGVLTKREQKLKDRADALVAREKLHPLTEYEAGLRAEKENAKIMKEGLDSEAIKRAQRAADALARQESREKAWLTAHPHKYIAYPKRPAFCIVCLERAYDSWLESHLALEAKWAKGFNEDLIDNLEGSVVFANLRKA